MIPHYRQRLTLVLRVLVAATLAGCAFDDPIVAPDAGDSPNVAILQSVAQPNARPAFPLEEGNRWEYTRIHEFRMEFLNGSSQDVHDVFEASVSRKMAGTEIIWGREYSVEEVIVRIPGQEQPSRKWTRFREDHAGLYVADVAANLPPGSYAPTGVAPTPDVRGDDGDMLLTGRDPLADGANDPAKEWVRSALRRHARRFVDTRRLIETGIAHQRGEVPIDMTGRPGGPEQAELVWLSYPPSPNTRWIQRLAPFRIESVIEAHESLELPAGRFPAYRVRIENSLLDEDDTVTVWFGRCGRLAYRVHQESVALDVDTGEMVRITSDEAEFLTSIDLVEPGRCSGSRD